MDASSDEVSAWAAALAGDAEAFGGLFDRHQSVVYRHAFRLAGDRCDAEDLTERARQGGMQA